MENRLRHARGPVHFTFSPLHKYIKNVSHSEMDNFQKYIFLIPTELGMIRDDAIKIRHNLGALKEGQYTFSYVQVIFA